MIFKILGNFENCKTSFPLNYFEERNIFLDCRGKIYIDDTAMLGFNISIFTMSHDPHDWSKYTYRDVYIGKNVFIGSHSILYNTKIGNDSVVGIGSVVRSRDIPINSMVEGNPAVIIKRKVEGRWVHCYEPIKLKGAI